MKIVLFNGPPRCGKDTSKALLCELISDRGLTAIPYSFAAPLKLATHEMYGLRGYDVNHFEHTKDIANPLFGGRTPRGAYIEVSEQMIKPVLGKEHFGHCLVNFAKDLEDKDSVIVVSDCGFEEEVRPLMREFGQDNITIVQLKREGTSFANDSRNYIYIPVVEMYYPDRIDNSSGIPNLVDELTKVLDWVVK